MGWWFLRPPHETTARRAGLSESYSDVILRLVGMEDDSSGPYSYSLPRRGCYARHGVDRPASRHAGPRLRCVPRPPQRGMEARPCSSQ